MKARGLATLGAVVAGITIGMAAPAQAAPEGPDDAEQTIAELQQQGVVVIVEQQTALPLDRATVMSVRPGQDYLKPSADVVYLEVG